MDTALADSTLLDRLNREFIAAVQASDAKWFDAHLAADFLNSNADGSLSDRAAFLERIARPPGISEFAASDVRIRLFADIAIIHGRTTYKRGDGSPAAGRYTDMWARTDGGWLCVAAHVTRG